MGIAWVIGASRWSKSLEGAGQYVAHQDLATTAHTTQKASGCNDAQFRK